VTSWRDPDRAERVDRFRKSGPTERAVLEEYVKAGSYVSRETGPDTLSRSIRGDGAGRRGNREAGEGRVRLLLRRRRRIFGNALRPRSRQATGDNQLSSSVPAACSIWEKSIVAQRQARSRQSRHWLDASKIIVAAYLWRCRCFRFEGIE
jgi:hypothetical protein